VARHGEQGAAVVLVVYATAPGEAAGAKALEASVRNFRVLVGASDTAGPVTAKPATVAGRPGSAGGETNAAAMDFPVAGRQASALHWWAVPTPKGQFVLAFAARDAALGREVPPADPGGLRADGC
jgi:hypothetical protein